MSKITERVWEMAEPIAGLVDKKVYNVEYKKEGAAWFLRIFLCGDTPVTLDDCESVSNAISTQLDESDIIKQQYYLEVSSAGLERELLYDWHYDGAIGEILSITLYEELSGAKRFEGVLTYADSTILKISTEDGEVAIDRPKIAHARTVFR